MLKHQSKGCTRTQLALRCHVALECDHRILWQVQGGKE